MSECPTCGQSDIDQMQKDVGALLRLLGLGDHGRPISCHQIMVGEITAEIKKLQALALRAFLGDAIRATKLPRDPEAFRVSPGAPDPAYNRAFRAGWDECEQTFRRAVRDLAEDGRLTVSEPPPVQKREQKEHRNG